MTEEDAFKKLPPAELKLRRKLGEALMRFVRKLTAGCMEGIEEKMRLRDMGIEPESEGSIDDDELRMLSRNFRIEVERIAKKGVECSFTWHTLATWTESGRERIGFFSRALACLDDGRDDVPGMPPRPAWSDVHTRADCLYEIGRVHAHEGDAAVARDFLLRALPLAKEAELLQREAKVEHVDNLEGRIAELLVQLPDGPEGAEKE